MGLLFLLACTSPAEPEPDLTVLTDAQQRETLMRHGEAVYQTCAACHQQDGRGLPPTFPPLVGQKAHMGDCAKHATIVVHGLNGELVVDGQTYNGVMPAQGAMLSDYDIAAVLTYERNSWGNDYGVCLPEDVAKVR